MGTCLGHHWKTVGWGIEVPKPRVSQPLNGHRQAGTREWNMLAVLADSESAPASRMGITMFVISQEQLRLVAPYVLSAAYSVLRLSSVIARLLLLLFLVSIFFRKIIYFLFLSDFSVRASASTQCATVLFSRQSCRRLEKSNGG